MSNEYIVDEIREDVGIITLNRPQTLNTVNEKMLEELAHSIRNFNQHRNIRVIVLRGIEQAFSAGLDIKALAADIDNTKTILQKM